MSQNQSQTKRDAQSTNDPFANLSVAMEQIKVGLSRFGSGRYTRLATVTIPIPALGLKMLASVSMNYEDKPEGETVITAASLPRNVLGLNDSDEADAIKALALDAATREPWFAAHMAKAETALQTWSPSGKVVKRDNRELAPRLVKTLKRSTSAESANVSR